MTATRARHASTTNRRRTPPARVRRRRLRRLGALALGILCLGLALTPLLDKAAQEIVLPLRHEDVIRQQARDKALDPALIAAVIYVESRFRDQTSPAGAKGLMQILPETAEYIADLSGGTEFEHGDLATPQINIAYGSYYLRYLMRKYGDNEVLALAAYNAGEGKVDEWITHATGRRERFRVARHVPFPETRNYVTKVLEARDDYRREYPRELGL